MSIHAKEMLVGGFEERIGDFLTVKQTRQTVAALKEELQTFEVDTVADGTVNTEKLKIFLDAKKVEGRSEKTINRYSYILERMIYDIGVPIEQIDTANIRAYLMSNKDRGLSDSSLEGIRSVASSFFGWLWKESLIKTNPCANIGAIKCQKKIRLPYSAVDIEKLKDGCTTLRDKAIICFLLATGARISEVCALNKDDINFRDLECKVLGKGNKERTVYFDAVTSMTLQSYFENRSDKSEALFVAQKEPHNRLDPHSIRGILKEIEDVTGVENVHPHRFRRTLATNLINHGMPVQEVAMILGHENINTTMKYVFIDKAGVKNSYRRYM